MPKRPKNMPENLTTLEEFDFRRKVQTPHLSFYPLNLIAKKNIAFIVLSNKETEILLINSLGFKTNSVFAGLSEGHIEYVAKNGPIDYKENLLKILKDQEMIKGAFEIAKAMDEDLGGNVTKNQERVNNVIQYIKDNEIAFKF